MKTIAIIGTFDTKGREFKFLKDLVEQRGLGALCIHTGIYEPYFAPDVSNAEVAAAVGEDILRSILETDEGSCYFGEMALVDQRSPIARQGVIFYSTLYDENASCHIALGLAGAPNMTDEEREAKGINHSILHVDFMVGSDDMSIRGQKQDGTWEDVFVNGRWAW